MRVRFLGILFTLCFLSTISGQAQEMRRLEGQLLPKKKLHLNQRIEYGKVFLMDSAQHLIDSTTTDAEGMYHLLVPDSVFDSGILLLEVSARNQKSYTYDSVCPYILSKTPRGYLDMYTTLKLKDVTHIQDLYLEGPLVCHFNGFDINFKFNSDSVINHPFISLDTTCICLYNLSEFIKKKNYKFYLNVYLPYNSEENLDSINPLRLHRIEQALYHHFKFIPKIKIQAPSVPVQKEFKYTALISMVVTDGE